MRKENSVRRVSFGFKGLFWCLLGVAAVLVAVVAIFPNNDTAVINSEQSHAFNDDWALEGENRTVTLPCVIETQAGDTVTISRAVPELAAQTATSISFITSMQSLQVEVDGKRIYEYCQNPDAYFDVQEPPAWHVVRLTPDMAGKTLCLRYSSSLDNYAGVLNSIEIGSKYANVSGFLGSHLLSIVLCLMIFTFGLFAIAVCLFAHSHLAPLNRLLYLGIASVLIALWSACETKAMQIFTGNVQVILFITFLSIMLFPIALLLFFRESFTGRVRSLYNVLLAAFFTYFVAVTVLQCLSILNFMLLFPLLLGMIGLLLLLVFCSIVRAYVKQPTAQNRIPVLAVFFLVTFSLLDMSRYWFGALWLTGSSDTSRFARVGILLMIFTLGYSSIRQILDYYTESTKAQVYKTLSQTDSLTKLRNRAFLSEIYPAVFRSAMDGRRPFSAIMLDIDNFKDYNDHYGHAAGDEVIVRVAQVILAARTGPVEGAIRYGGEEFLLLLPGAELKKAVETARDIQSRLAHLQIPHAYSATAPFITISQGIHSAVPTSGDSLEQFIDLADQALYRAKKNQKSSYAIYSPEA